MKRNPTLREQALSANITTPQGGTLPAYVRMPQPGNACPITGLRRGALYELARAGKVKTATIRRKGSMRGIRLVQVESLLAYVASCADAPEQLEQEELIES
jgi:hypothetical protein